MARVTFAAADRTLAAAPGTRLLALARRASLPIARACGGRGICDSCGLRVETGAAHLETLDPPGAVEAMRLPPGWVMACLTRVRADAPSDAEVRLWSPAWGPDPRRDPDP